MLRRTVRTRTTALAIAVGLAGCATTPTNLGSGEPCLRSEQCVAGLVCNAGACTSDLTGFGDGVLAGGDAGVPEVDASIDDGGAPDVDAGTPDDAGPIDAGPVMPDAGVDAGPSDAGHDAGPPDAGPIDAGHDAGPPDAGPPEVDAGPDEVDAGTDAGVDP